MGFKCQLCGTESLELDIYGGWGTELESGVGLDFGIIRYSYTRWCRLKRSRFHRVLRRRKLRWLRFMYSVGDELGDQYEISYGYDLESVSLAAAYGNYDISGNDDDYDYYSLGVSGSFGGESDLGWDVSYWGTSSEGEVLFGDLGDDRLVLTISKEF